MRHRNSVLRRARPTRSRLACAVLFALAAACSRSQSGSVDAGAGSIEAAGKPTPRRLVNAASAGKCTLSYHCGLSHPGLGRTSDLIAVDLAECTKTVARSSGPYDEHPPPRPTPPPPPPKTKLAPATCNDLAKMVTEITDVDVSEARESAPVDTTACHLAVGCPDEVISVQRQSLTGTSPVVRLIRALHSAR